jgi:tRNA (guanine37-N1)-methyltransferase
MVLQAEVFEKAFVALLKSQDALSALEQSVSSFRLTGVFQPQDQLPFVIHLSPQGRVLNSVFAKKLSCGFNHLVLLCGHYEGIDERVIESFVHQEVSVGDYVLTGGEPAAAIFIDCLSRFVDQVVGDAQSVSNDTFELTNEALRDEHLPGLLKHPVYTRPQSWRGRDVPAVLLSGDHKKIEKWRKTKQLERTQSKRPDLIKK